MKKVSDKKRKYDLAIIGTVGLPPRYGGFETLADNLVRQLAAKNRIAVAHSIPSGGVPSSTYLGADLVAFGWRANGWQSIPYDVFSMCTLAPQARTILILGVSGCIALPLIRLLWPSTHIVTNVDGAEWRRQKWGRLQRAFLRWSEWMAVRFSHVVVADNEAIRIYLRQIMNADSKLIAYGGDTADEDNSSVTKFTLPFNGQSYYLSVCRIEPENNIAEILEAFARADDQRLVQVGNWDDSEYGRRLRSKYFKSERIQLLDPIYDRRVLKQLRVGALAHVHGHSAGGTNPTLVEAMTCGMATLCFDVPYNRYTTQNSGFFWATSKDLTKLLNSLEMCELESCAEAMKKIADSVYTWKHIADCYREVLQLN